MNAYFTKRAHADPYIGRRVRVRTSARYGGGCIGHTGTIKVCWNMDSVGVDLDLMVNEGSSYGYYYFTIADLDFIDDEKATASTEEGENQMEKLTNYLNVAEIEFIDDGSCRTFECANYDDLLSVGDLCVVKTRRHGMGLARVVHLCGTTEADLYREVVTRLDTTDYEDRVEKRKKAAELKAKMQERAKQLQDIVLYRTLAKEDPEMAAMLQEFMTLG